MKTFTTSQGFTTWLKTITTKTSIEATRDVAKQAYEDSVKYTFYDTGDMYDSGRNSDFGHGYVVIKAPQVRRLYYTNWAVNKTNPTSTPQWWEATKKENINSYKKIIIDIFNRKKGE